VVHAFSYIAGDLCQVFFRQPAKKIRIVAQQYFRCFIRRRYYLKRNPF
jgi:hypothetical protein